MSSASLRTVRRRPVGRSPWRSSAVLTVIAGLAACSRTPSPPQGPAPVNDAEAETLADFKRRVDEYVVLHKKLEDRLPKLPNEATPTQIDVSQRELGKQIAEARAGAPQGELFTPAMAAIVRKHFARIFGGAGRRRRSGPRSWTRTRSASRSKSNQRYPDEVPMSTMPPTVLKILPKMPEELEYRFVGRTLVIMDVHAHLIADFIPDAIPG